MGTVMNALKIKSKYSGLLREVYRTVRHRGTQKRPWDVATSIRRHYGRRWLEVFETNKQTSNGAKQTNK